MTPGELRNQVRLAVEAYATKTGANPGTVWLNLYSRFSYHVNYNFERHAYQQEKKQIDVIEAEGLLPQFVEFAFKYFGGINPALPEKEKAPVQWSLLEGGSL